MTNRAALVGLLDENLRRNGFRIHYRVVPEIPGATVSEALYALADPGSVVLAASPEEPRTKSLLQTGSSDLSTGPPYRQSSAAW